MPRIFRGLYDRVLLLSRHRHAERYLVGLTVAEATVFPVPPDVMLAPMVLADRTRAWRLALMTTIASVLGGLIGYLIGYLALELAMPLIERAGYLDAYEQAVEAFRRFGVWFVIVAGFTPIPFKIITVAGGALAMSLPGFILGSIIGRGARFFLVAGIIYAGGEQAAERLRNWVDALGWAVVGLTLVAGLVWWWLS
jgi:membrane protein YqaA with SNARE-associated domain